MALPTFAEADDRSSAIPLRKLILRDIVHTPRTAYVLGREQYYRCTQHDGKQFDWDGNLLRFGKSSGIPASGYVPLKSRKPAARMDLGRVIVRRFTALVFGSGRFPTPRVEGDSDAEDYVQELCKATNMVTKMAEARSLGGATGTACVSWGFANGAPRVEVHNPAHVEVLRWADYDRRRPAQVLLAYTYHRKVWKGDKLVTETRYYARYWDESQEVVWNDIPEEIAATPHWHTLPPSAEIQHGAGFCPFYWTQNLPVSGVADGESDYEGLEDNFDELDILLSVTTKGVKLNTDPTLVVHDNPNNNDGLVRKGSDFAIYSEKGAKYLELAGTSIQAAREMMKDLRQYTLDQASCIIPDPEKMSAQGMSGAAMRIRFAPMTAQADILRTQYGDLLVEILRDMLVVARELQEPKSDENGVYWSKLNLPPRIEWEDEEGEDEEGEEHEGEGEEGAEEGEHEGPKRTRKREPKEIERTPGKSNNVTLQWSPYFPATWEDRKNAVETAKSGSGGKAVISQRTAAQSVAELFGVADVDQELGEIDADADRAIGRQEKMMGMGGPLPPAPPKGPPKPGFPPGAPKPKA